MNPIIHKRAIQSSLAQLGAVSIRWIRQVAVWLQPYRSAILPWVILCMAFILRVAALGQHELNGDEGFSWAFLKLPYLEIVSSTFILHEPHPVGAYWLQRTVMLIMGRSEFAIRFASVWIGMLAVPLVYRLVRQLGLSKLTGCIALAMMALSPFAIQHSRMARMYGMSLGLTLASTCLMLEVLARPRWRSAIAYTLVTTAALYVHYYAGFVILAQAIYVALRMVATVITTAPKNSQPTVATLWQHYRHWLAAMVIVTALYTPWLWVARDILQTYRGAAFSPDLRLAMSWMMSAFWLGDEVEHADKLMQVTAILSGAITLGGLVFLAAKNRQTRVAALWLLLYLCIPPLVIFIGSRGRSIFAPRYLIAGLPPFIVLVSVCVTQGLQASTWRRWISIASGVCLATGLVAMLFGYYRDLEQSTQSWRALAAMAQRFDGNLPESQYRVALNVPDPSLEYYYDKPSQIVVIPYRYGDPIAAEQTVRELAQAGVRRVLLQVLDGGWAGHDIAKNALRKEFTQMEEQYTGRWIVQVYGRMTPDELLPVTGNTTFDQRFTVTHAKIIPDLKGNYIEVHLRWAGNPEQLKGGEKIYVHVRPLAINDQVFGQLDIPFTPDILQKPVNSYGLRLAERMPAGIYHVVVGIYDAQQPGLPRLRTTDNVDDIELARFTIE